LHVFGKAECEWVPASFWTEELVALGWLTFEDSEKRPALGMADLPEGRKPWCWTRTFMVTARGWDVREADIADFRQRMAAMDAEAAPAVSQAPYGNAAAELRSLLKNPNPERETG